MQQKFKLQKPKQCPFCKNTDIQRLNGNPSIKNYKCLQCGTKL